MYTWRVEKVVLIWLAFQLMRTVLSQSVHVGKAAAAEATHIPAYKPSTGSNLGIFDTVNRVKTYQNHFKVRIN